MSKTSPKVKNTNKAKPGVRITLDKERTLLFDLNAMVAFEEAAGKGLFDGSFDYNDMSLKEIRAMLWVCLLHEDDSLTVKQVGSWVTVSNMVKITSQLTKAFEVAMPESEGEETAPLAKIPPVG